MAALERIEQRMHAARSLALAMRATGMTQQAIADRLTAAGMEVERETVRDWLAEFLEAGKSANHPPPAVATPEEFLKIDSEILDWARSEADKELRADPSGTA